MSCMKANGDNRRQQMIISELVVSVTSSDTNIKEVKW